jgi:transcriptional regulator with XRE-family HTH domain
MIRSCFIEIIKTITSQVIKVIPYDSLTMQQRSNASSSSLTDSFATLLKQWRNRACLSQLDLALASQVSQRHISFLESGRAKPSRDMVLKLATVLEIPLRQQNLMLTASGFSPIHAETDLSSPEMTSIRRAIDFMLRQQEPYPAIVMDRYWNLLLTNDGATRFLSAFIDLERLQANFCIDGKINLMQVIFHSQGLRPFIVNWEEFAGHLLQRVHREAIASGPSEQSTALLNELMSYPGVSDIWQTSDKSTQHALLLTIHLKRNRKDFQFFSTIVTLGTPYDITLQELRIECLFPASEVTEENWKHI